MVLVKIVHRNVGNVGRLHLLAGKCVPVEISEPLVLLQLTRALFEAQSKGLVPLDAFVCKIS